MIIVNSLVVCDKIYNFMTKKFYFLLILNCLVVGSLLLIHPCMAQNAANTANTVVSEEELELPQPLGHRSIPVIIGDVLKYILGFVGVIALVMFIYGGFTWMTSGGNADKIKTGKNAIVWAILGMAFIFLSYAIVEFLLKAFANK
ncbi:MAG: pilin [Patescibacteria group bacterium]|nr:pilin [Patescibacteria group bacterium]MDD5164117.1 pilin [Patescibacteria group bacterium]MDD5534225.1 pilin [Patescibacteria group bacterium]